MAIIIHKSSTTQSRSHLQNTTTACTRMNSQTVLASGACAYWANGQGKINDGYCVAYKNNNGVDCKIGCPNSFDPCQYLEDDGTCSFGYVACLQKMGCGGRGGQADCIGTATGMFFCRARLQVVFDG